MNATTELLDRIREAVQALLGRIAETAADPAAHVADAIVFLGIAVAVFGIALVVLAMLFTPKRTHRTLRRIGPAPGAMPVEEGAEETAAGDVTARDGDVGGAEPAERPQEPTAPRARKRRKFPPSLLVLGAVGVLAAMSATVWVVTGSDAYCADACHAQSSPVQAVATGVHDEVACVSCHESRGPALAAVSRVRFVATTVGLATARTATVDSAACLDCHENLDARSSDASRTSPLSMSHAEPLEAGMHCSECHGEVAHISRPEHGRVPLVAGAMSQCLRCHDAKTASATCETCHNGDPARSAVSDLMFEKAAIPADVECAGCHEQDKCDACHGLRMPHSQEFLNGGHARIAAFSEGEKLCTRCHVRGSCSSECHSLPFDEHGGQAFKTEHATYPFDSGCGCHAARVKNLETIRKPGKPYCELCHYPSSARLLPAIR
jgi:hypothetical protein